MSTRAERGLLSVNELATYLGVTRSTVYRLVREGELQSVKVGRRKKFRPEDIDAYLEQGKLA